MVCPTEFREEKGQRVERLMVNCDYCGQPRPSAQVLRLSAEEFKNFEEQRSNLSLLNTLGGLFAMAMVVGSIYVWFETQSWIVALCTAVAIMIAVFCALTRWENQCHRKEREALARHIGVSPHEVAMTIYEAVNYGSMKYIVLPEE